MSPQEYTDKFSGFAKEVEQNYKVPSLVTMGMSALESGWATSDLAVNYNNFFGMSKGSWTGKVIIKKDWYIDSAGVKVWYDQPFRWYDTPEQSFLDYGKVLKAGYPLAFKYSDPIQFVNSLLTEHHWSDGKPKRYADDPKYLDKFKEAIKKINLSSPIDPIYAGSNIWMILLLTGAALSFLVKR